MDTCTIETGLLRKKPCGHAAVAHCLNCEQPLCVQHAVAQLTEAGHKSGKFLCQECVAALKQHARSMAAVAKTQEERKLSVLADAAKSQMEAGFTPAPAKAPAAHTPPAPAQPESAPKPKESEALEFTPRGGKPEKS